MQAENSYWLTAPALGYRSRVDDPIRTLLRQAREGGLTYRAMSDAIGRNHAYIQQFVKRGTPQTLPEDVRPKLARLLNVDESRLAPPGKARAPRARDLAELTYVSLEDEANGVASGALYKGRLPGSSPEADARSGAGRGQRGLETQVDGWGGHRVVDEWVFPTSFHHEMRTRAGLVWIMPVIGNSMEPVLQAGDRILVDTTHTAPNPDAIYVIDEGDGPEVKQFERIRGSRPPAIRVISVNDTYTAYERPLSDVRIIGRVCGRVSRM